MVAQASACVVFKQTYRFRAMELPILLCIALHAGSRSYNGQTEFVRFQKPSGLVQGFVIFQLRRIWVSENPRRIVFKLLNGWFCWKLCDFVRAQFVCIFIPTLLEEATQKEVVLQCLHVFLESGCARGRFTINRPVVD